MASVKPREWKKPDGSTGRGYEVRYVDPATGKRPSKTFALKKDADAYRRKVEREIEDGVHVGREMALSVKDVCARFVVAAEARRRRGEIGATRLEGIGIHVDKHIVPAIGSKLFRDLTVADVDGLFDRLTSTLSPFYARQILGNLATIEKWAARQGHLRTSPVALALGGMRRVPTPRIEVFTSEQVQLLLGYVLRRPAPRKRYAAQLACIVHLAACCGLRLGEIRALDRNSIDLDRKRLRICRNLTRLKELKGPKSRAGYRDVPLPDHLCEMLRLWLDTYFLPNGGEYVFTTYAATPLDPSNVRYAWHVLLRECGLYHQGAVFHFHALRHFAGSWWLEHNMPIQDVALQLGHGNASTTLQIYAHTVSKVADRQSAMTHMGRLLLTATDAPVTHEAANP